MSRFSTINADLHCHSVVSDGTLTPEALAERAKNNGVQLWALTDHDELGGQERAREAARALGIDYLSGVEISVTWAGQTIHIVGLGIDAHHVGIIEGLRRTRGGRGERAKLMAEQLQDVGVPGAYEGALHYAGNHDLISRTHFARFLVEKGVCKDTEHVFRNYLVEGKPGFVPHMWAKLDDAVAWIKDAGGIAVIAHPGRYNYNAMQMDELFKHFKDIGGQGIEVVTGSHSPDQYLTFAKVAQQYGFLASRGSDFHDPSESHTDLGRLPPLPDHLTPVWSAFH
jgi:predicted metal-dependent phosphoesterase TrpH